MSNEQVISALYATGIENRAVQEVIALLRLQMQAKKAWPYIVLHRKHGIGTAIFDGKLEAVKGVKYAFDMGLKEAKDLVDLLWNKVAPSYIYFKGESIPYMPEIQIAFDKCEYEYLLLDQHEVAM